jgi:predicted RNA-binding Zn-ribbon protein involved in translation (DUF1610 family)
MTKCNICDCQFHAVAEHHYISRDEEVTGISGIVGREEPKIYDTFDCPNCGCQVIVQERKRELI